VIILQKYSTIHSSAKNRLIVAKFHEDIANKSVLMVQWKIIAIRQRLNFWNHFDILFFLGGRVRAFFSTRSVLVQCYV